MNRAKLVVSEALRSIKGNLSTSFAATMTVLIGMFLLGLFIALGTWVVSWSDHVKSQLEVKVFFVDDVKPKQVNTVRIYLEKDDRIKEFRFVTKEEALKRMEKRYPELTANLPSNPLPASYEVLPNRAEEVKAIAADLRSQKFAGRRAGQGRPADLAADPSGRPGDRDRLPRRGHRAARRVDAAHREHHPALDPLASP